MTTYEDNLLAPRFAALAPEPLAGDWDDILARAGRARNARRHFAGSLRSRPRRRLVVLAAVALVIVVGAASALAVRAILGAKGIVGLAPVGTTPSTPARGELVLSFMFGRTGGDHGRFLVSVYEDGRMIWQRTGDYSLPVTDEHRNSTGWLERRLTPEGVELIRAEVLSSGLVEHDLHLTSGEGLYFGSIDLRSGDRSVHVSWGDGVTFDGVSEGVTREPPTPEQASALVRLDERLEDPASWLTASAWEDPENKAFVPSGYTVCLQGKKGLGLSSVLALLPPAAEDLLRTQENTPDPYTNLIGTFVPWCSQLANDEARALERILDDAGVRGSKSVFGLEYGPPDIAYADATEFSLRFNPMFPDQG
jgi:hypothetical protein